MYLIAKMIYIHGYTETLCCRFIYVHPIFHCLAKFAQFEFHWNQ